MSRICLPQLHSSRAVPILYDFQKIREIKDLYSAIVMKRSENVVILRCLRLVKVTVVKKGYIRVPRCETSMCKMNLSANVAFRYDKEIS